MLLAQPPEKEGHGLPVIRDRGPQYGVLPVNRGLRPGSPTVSGGETERYAPGFHPLGMIRAYGHSIFVQYPSYALAMIGSSAGAKHSGVPWIGQFGFF